MDSQLTNLRSRVVVGEELGRYRLEDELGRGGMGMVFIALDTHLDRRVALKLIAPEISGDENFRARFMREMRIAAQLEHPNIVPVYEAGEVEGLLFIAMRYVEGQDLRARLHEEGGLDAEMLASVSIQLGAALDAAHARGLVHRDVKPANILIGQGARSQHLYLTDFGLAREAVSDTGLTNTGQWMGTVDYVAPEQLEAGTISARTDIYSMGCLLFELLTGSVPFTGPMARKLFAHMNLSVPSVRDAGGMFVGQIDAVLARATAKDPAARFHSAGDLGRAYAEALEGRTPSGSERSVATGAALTGIPSLVNAPSTRRRVSTAVPHETRFASTPSAAGTRPPAGARADTRPAAPSTVKQVEPPTLVTEKRRRVPLVLALVAALLLAGAAAAVVIVLGHHSASPSSGRALAAATVTPVTLHVATPTNDATSTGTSVAVRGTVDPVNATVEVQGRPAHVNGGVFSATATVGPGKNTIDIEASAKNAAPASTSIVVTGQQSTGSGGASQQVPVTPNQSSGTGGSAQSTGSSQAGGLPNESTTQMAADITPVLVQFYQDQIDGQYQSMIPLTSPRYQQAYIDPDPSQWEQNQSAGTKYFSGAQNIAVTVTDTDPSDSSVTIDITGLGFSEPRSSCTSWQGISWAQYVNGSWRFDPATDAAPSREAFAQANKSQLLGEGCLT